MDKDNLSTATAMAIPSAPYCYNIIVQSYYQFVGQDEEDNPNEKESLLQNNFNNIELSKYNANFNKSNTAQEPKEDTNVPSLLDNIINETNYEIPQEHGIGEPYSFGAKIDFPKFKSIYEK